MCAQVETEGFGKLARAMGYMPAGLPDYFVYQAKPLIKPQVGHWVPCLTCGCHILWCILACCKRIAHSSNNQRRKESVPH